MVARPGQYQASFNSGELAPNTWGRSDIKQFYSGASRMVNAEPVPQGGFDGLPGSRETGFVRGAIAAVSYTSSIALGPHAGPADLFIATFAPVVIELADIIGLSCDAALSNAIIVETSANGVDWFQIGHVLSANPTKRNRRLGDAPFKGRLASQLRIRLSAVPLSPATFTLDEVRVLQEVSPALDGRHFDHTFSVDDAFTITLTSGHADIWKGDTYVASVSTPYLGEHLPGISREQRLDTMLLFHQDVPTQRIMRRESDFDWSADPAPYESVPLVDFGGSYGNVVDDIWDVLLTWSDGPTSLRLEVTVNGEPARSVVLTGAPDWFAFCADLKAAIEDLPSVRPGIVVSTGHTGATSPATITIAFTGTGNSGQRFALVPRISNVAWAAATASHTQIGDPGGEAIMSPSRGYPGTGAFYQDGLFLGGFRSISAGLLRSVVGEYFDLNTRLENAAGGILLRLDSSGAERIRYLARSKHLVIFTDDGEYYISDRAIVRGTPPNVAQSSRNGIAIGIPPAENEGGLIYVGRSRSIIYAATYSDVSQSYESEPVSLLASHLVSGLRSAAIQRSSESTDAARYWAVRDDGLMIVGVMIRNQEVTAFVRWQTDGIVRDVCVDGANVPFALVQRRMGGVNRLVRERLTPDAIMHQEKVFAYGSPTQVVTGLESLNGATVWAMADGYADGPFVVAGGSITLNFAASHVVVGRWTPPRVDTLPLPRLVGERVQLARPVRVHTVRATSQGATALAIGANGRPAREVPLLRGGQVSDQPIPPYFGPVSATGLLGWTEDGVVTFTQTRPGRFGIRNITIEARI